MPDLIAQGPQNYHRWRREIPDPTSGADLVIGRRDADWNVPWDNKISRAHVRVIPQPSSRVEIVVVRTARNPVFFQGEQKNRFVLVPGEHFVIGETTFTLANRAGSPAASGRVDDSNGIAITENVFDHVALRRKSFKDASSRIEILSRLPDLIASSETDQELLVRVTSVLLQSTPAASSVSILSAERIDSDPEASIELLHYDNRDATMDGASVSRKLIRRSIEQRESVLHVWAASPLANRSHAFTQREDVDWAYCVPLRTEACRGWVIYVSGQVPEENRSGEELSDNLRDDVKFAELVGSTVASLRQSHRLQHRQAAMRHFFAPVVMKALATGDSDKVLEPRESDLTVMFCDLRGFSKRSEQHADNLIQLLSDVSEALGVMTKHILGFDGVIGDFHGDAAMGFWGWPLRQTDAAERAANAALCIRKDYLSSDHGFRCGIGIAQGTAVAGRIGTVDQVKVTAFGPVVNLASRLESMTKLFGAEIIIDSAAEMSLRNSESAACRTRRLAKVRPAGFASVVEVFQLLPNEAAEEKLITDEMIDEYLAAVEALEKGRDGVALDHLMNLPEWDGPSRFLIDTIQKANHDQGVIVLSK